MNMENRFFEKPILNSPYEYPSRHWELDTQGQPTQKIIEKRRRAEFITPIPKPKKRKTEIIQQDIFFVTNYHALKLRDRMELSKGGRSLLQGRSGEELKDTRNRRPDDSAEVINLVTLESNLKYSIIILATQ